MQALQEALDALRVHGRSARVTSSTASYYIGIEPVNQRLPQARSAPTRPWGLAKAERIAQALERTPALHPLADDARARPKALAGR